MKLLGITGGVGMGKSTTGSLFEKKGIAVTDTDRIARQLVEPGQPAFEEIVSLFGPSVVSPDGSLDRKELARRVFGNPAERARLEAILHPKIRLVWAAEAEKWRSSGVRLGAVIIPLLYETKAESHFDAVICIACSTATQFDRLRERGWSNAEIKNRLEAQWPAEEKVARANYVIWTDAPVNVHAAQLERVISQVS
jgi:dephospho-CoA kinase